MNLKFQALGQVCGAIALASFITHLIIKFFPNTGNFILAGGFILWLTYIAYTIRLSQLEWEQKFPKD